MSQNPYIKKLKAFNPKEDLNVDESFHKMIRSASNAALDELLEADDSASAGANAGREIATFKTSSAITAGLTPVTIADMNQEFILAVNKKGNAYLLDLDPNSQKFSLYWKINIPGTLYQEPVVRDGIVYFVTREGAVYALHLSGSEQKGKVLIKPQVVWKKGLKKGVLTEPTLSRKMLIVASLAGLYAFDIYAGPEAKGKLLWFKELNGIVSSPVYDQGQLFVGSEDKKFYAFGDKGDNISKQWEVDLNDAVRMKPYLSKTGRSILVSSIDGTLYNIDRNSGQILWIFIAYSPLYSDIISSVYDGEEFFFFGSDSGEFFCVNSAGKEKWRYKSNGKIRSEPSLDKGIIVFGSHDNHIYALDMANGRLKYKFATDGNIYGKIMVKDNALLFGSGDSFVYAVAK